jgi:hypothetical protein
MKLSEWIEKGTIYFPRWDGVNFTVIPGSSVYLAGLYPKKLIKKYGHDSKKIDYVVNFLSKQFGYKPERIHDRETKISPTISSNIIRDFNSTSSSWAKRVNYTSTLMNTMPPPLKKEMPSMKEIEDEALNWQVLDWRCDCGRAGTVDEYCSMPFDTISKWGISMEEYNQSFHDPRLPKYYAKVPCKHIIEGLYESGVYPNTLNYENYNNLFLRMSSDLISQFVIFEKSEKLTGNSRKDNLKKQQQMDVILQPYVKEMGLGYVQDYIQQLYLNEIQLQDIAERMRRKLGLPKPKFI